MVSTSTAKVGKPPDVSEASQLPSTSVAANGSEKDHAQPKAAATSKAQNRRPSEGSGEKLSGAELKKRAKAEKAARRAQEKQTKPQQAPAAPASQPQRKAQDGPEGSKKGSQQVGGANAHGKGQQKRPTGPSRPGAPQSKEQSQTKKDDKKVALFGHLYGQPRRTTIAGASKDVHPAVLALGLQISSYAICGSNARCLATLLAFKRVRDTRPRESVHFVNSYRRLSSLTSLRQATRSRGT